MKISGLTIIRNALSNGYTICEVLANLRLISDEIVVCDGFSDDGTFEYLQTVPDIKLYQDNWNLNSQHGFEFTRITELGLSRCTGDYVFYLQADEVMHDEDVKRLPGLIEGYNSINLSFRHIRYDFKYCLDWSGNRCYSKAIRFFKNNVDIYPYYDAYTFSGDVHPMLNSDIIVYHVGYVFLKNILQKMVNHADFFYTDHSADSNYQTRKTLAVKYLKLLERGETLDKLEIAGVLEPMYSLIEHGTPIPNSLLRLENAVEYTLKPAYI